MLFLKKILPIFVKKYIKNWVHKLDQKLQNNYNNDGDLQQLQNFPIINSSINIDTLLSQEAATPIDVIGAYRVLAFGFYNKDNLETLLDVVNKYNHNVQGLFLNLLEIEGVQNRLNIPAMIESGITYPIEMKCGVTVFGIPGDFFVSDVVRKTGHWEPHVEEKLRKVVKPNDVVVDIGANIGCHTAILASCVGAEGKVLSFEPIPHLFQCLQKMKDLNKFTQLELFSLALGNDNCEVDLHIHPVNSGGSSIETSNSSNIIKNTQRIVKVEMKTLDSIIINQFSCLNFIKIDTEGAEPLILQGAYQTLKKFTPKILFEFAPQNIRSKGYDPELMLNQLMEIGYNFEFVGFDNNIFNINLKSTKEICRFVEYNYSFVELYAEVI